MPSTTQMLAEYADVLLEVIAELRNAVVDGSGSRQQVLERLAAELASPTSVQFAYQDLVDDYPDVERAIDLLLKEGGEVSESRFSRDFGSVRQMGPAKLEREAPWLNPEGVAELLYYYGFVGRAFRGAGQSAHTIIYLPSDIAPWLPRAQAAAPPDGLPVQPAPAPQRSRTVPADDTFLEDAGSLLGFLYTTPLRLTARGPDKDDTDRLVERLQLPFDDAMPDQNTRLALLLHVANRMGWLRRNEAGAIALTGNPVRAFLDKTRAEQRHALFDAWRLSPDWNDLLKTPDIDFGAGSVSSDPQQSRAALLNLFARLNPTAWYRLSALVVAIKEREPNFLRSTGRFDEWNLRSNTTQESLSGFDHWDDVEGALIQSMVRGPLHWLGAVDLAEPAAGNDWLMTLTSWGARWLGQDIAQPNEPAHRALQVKEDFTVVLPAGASLSDRFRVERFALWQSSYPNHVFQINQRSLARAAAASISTGQILEFLNTRTRHVPEKVTAALRRFSRSASIQPVDTPAKKV